jgi:hypothetical protein
LIYVFNNRRVLVTQQSILTLFVGAYQRLSVSHSAVFFFHNESASATLRERTGTTNKMLKSSPLINFKRKKVESTYSL